MTIDAARFEAAMTTAQFVAQMQENQGLFIRNYELTEISNADLAFWQAQGPLQVLVLANDWCIDTITALPAVARLAALLGDDEFKLRMLLDEGNEDIAEAYPRESGRQATPVFIFFDAHMRERVHLVERPAAATIALAQAEAEFVATHPGWPTDRSQRTEEQKTAIGGYRREYRIRHYHELSQMLFADLRQLLELPSPFGAEVGVGAN